MHFIAKVHGLDVSSPADRAVMLTKNHYSSANQSALKYIKIAVEVLQSDEDGVKSVINSRLVSIRG